MEGNLGRKKNGEGWRGIKMGENGRKEEGEERDG